MRTLYLDCSAGASGDMISAALADLLPDENILAERIAALNIPGITVETERTKKCEIGGVKVIVKIDGHTEKTGDMHRHTGLSDIRAIINGLDISEKVRNDAISVYNIIADAESDVHGRPVDHVHFHEVGAMDALADVVGACILMEILGPELIIASPVRVGYGHVRCSHGILPIPAPATERILRGIPTYAGEYEGEFCTPTGAAILKHFTDRFENMPLMTFDDVGYGMGENDFEIANFMRAYIGDTCNSLPRISELRCNLDDITSEELAYALDLLMENGALDAFITPIVMKKNRPAFMLTCLCRESDSERFAGMMMEHTSTTGVRMNTCLRHEMTSSYENVDTEYGCLRMKHSSGYGMTKEKPEFDDLSRLAKENGISISDLKRSIGRL